AEHAPHDDVGAVTEHAWPEHVGHCAADGEHRDHDQLAPLRAQQVREATEGGAEVLRPLPGDAGRVPAPGSARLGRSEVDVLVVGGDVAAIVDGRHAACSFSPICDCTISSYVGHVAISSSCVPRPTTTPSSSTRMSSAVEIVDTR